MTGNPAQVDVSWTVKNQGTGAGPTDRWFDRIVLSTNGTYGDGDDRLVGDFEHVGGLAPGTSYSRSEHVTLPANLKGQFTLFVVTDATGLVYEYTFETNNVTVAPNLVTVAPRLFPDLVVSDVSAPAAGSSGQPLGLSWTVMNQGGGGTDVSVWQDRVILSADTVLGNADDRDLGLFTRNGTLASGRSYTRSAQVVLPDGLSGDYYLFVVADALNNVDEFLNEGNNSGRTATPVAIALTPPPDLQVASITLPAEALTAGTLDVTWTVANAGTGLAGGSWKDRVYLSADDQVGNDTLLGEFVQAGGLGPGASRSRTETVTLPQVADGSYHIVVVTDATNEIYEHIDENNNSPGLARHVPRPPPGPARDRDQRRRRTRSPAPLITADLDRRQPGDGPDPVRDLDRPGLSIGQRPARRLGPVAG